jgi:hypothetical protein
MNRKLPKVSIALAAGGLLTAALAAGAATTASAATAPTWSTVLSVSNGTVPNDVSAVAATGPDSGWAFLQSGSTAYERTGATTWKAVTLPGISGAVGSAEASSSSNVWAAGTATAGTGTQLDRWNGKNWTEVRTFPTGVSLSVLGPNDVWASGGGVFHFNGRTWTTVSTTLQGASGLSDSSAWAFSGDQVDFYNGRTWTATSVASLFPASTGHGSPFVTGIIALAPNNVYAVGEGAQSSEGGGPAVVLHFNGRSWSQAAAISPDDVVGFGASLTADGAGGLWMVSDTHENHEALFHYSAGTLSVVTLSNAVAFSASGIPGTSKVLLGGFSNDYADSVVLQES